MFEIVWDKKEIERCIRECEGDQHFLDFLAPIHIFINGEKITKSDEIRGRVKSNLWDLSLNWLFVLKSIDPEKLGYMEFHYSSNVKNEVSGWDFNIFLDHNKETDILTLRYKDHSLNEYRTFEIPLKDYIVGVLQANTSLIEFIGKVAHGREEFGVVQSLIDGTATIDAWYRQRYGIKS
ncbi:MULTISPECIES: hypothetical protein [unclassified Methanoregula]|uniref:hypothetical protein n=1 Tax=unclassified Methanoregula TaxID=2649730 RepID=UPI0009CBD4DB|nr:MULTISPECIES: hypothetical protein [unclassified Methanoregula]OPX64694.1 MAG: hypothetical protein A4E33_00781 [Methanoregula sp. PtaB.Bin085]OPY36062.1 MAG: hypothetical protein A4E34_00469 [Methanoregula sp. PtaU1.Bin006]